MSGCKLSRQINRGEETEEKFHSVVLGVGLIQK